MCAKYILCCTTHLPHNATSPPLGGAMPNGFNLISDQAEPGGSTSGQFLVGRFVRGAWSLRRAVDRSDCSRSNGRAAVSVARPIST